MQYIARQVPLQAEEIEILALKGQETSGLKANRLLEDAGDPGHAPMLEDPCLHILEEQETLGGLKANCISKKNHLVSKHLPEMGEYLLTPFSMDYIYIYSVTSILDSGCSSQIDIELF